MAEDGGSGGTVYDEPSDVSAVDGVVLVDGPGSTALSLTPSAAQATSERLSSGAAEARTQNPVLASARAQPKQDPSTSPFALVVDDDPLILMDACDILERAGFRFFEAGNGDEALAVLEANWESITLLFTDVEMPGEMDGFALSRHVASHWAEIEIVVVSGRMRPCNEDLPGRATFVSKPFSAEIILEHLRKSLPDGKQPAQLRKAV
jgi:CheY-like chemotaxis protein